LPDPWIEARDRYQAGDVIIGTVTRLVPFGAFVQLDGGIEGIIPNTELKAGRVNKPEEVVQVGDHVEVRILDIRPEERRMTLSLRQAAPGGRERRSERDRGREDRVTIGEMVGDLLDERDESELEDEE
jgi:ribosomal protein S1